ncbi:MAG: hypothetical protein HY841_05860 [Bacteroidetes bacterium]|nr:hypothetical protein [Bacteroidota bacterium]
MADIKDKEYSALKENLENMGNGIEKHKDDTKKRLPPDMIQKTYQESEAALTKSWNTAKDAQTKANEAFDVYQSDVKKSEGLYNGDVHIIKGLYGIHSETLRDYGVQPEKPHTGRPPKPPTQ